MTSTTFLQRAIRAPVFPLAVLLAALALTLVAGRCRAATMWDGSAYTPWWFNPTNWSENRVPPNDSAGALTETEINRGPDVFGFPTDGAVVYDPANDPHFAAAALATYPSGYGPQHIGPLFITYRGVQKNLLTIKGDLIVDGPLIVGAAAGQRGDIVQENGTLSVPRNSLDLAQADTTRVGGGGGIYDYRAGVLEVSLEAGAGLRLGGGSASLAPNGQPRGPSSVGEFIVHNPATPTGHIRTMDMIFASYAGVDEGAPGPSGSVFNPQTDPSTVRGAGLIQFHFENGGFRPIQVSRNLVINSGIDPDTLGDRYSYLDLVLHEAPAVDVNGVPETVGLFDVNFDAALAGDILGTGSNGGFFNRGSSVDGDSSVFREGSLVRAGHLGTTTYEWAITYTGNITWADADNSVVASVTGPGTGTDVVLVGVRSFPEPSAATLAAAGLLALAWRSRRHAVGRAC